MATCQCRHKTHGSGDTREKCGRAISAADGNECSACVGGHDNSYNRNNDPDAGFSIGGV